MTIYFENMEINIVDLEFCFEYEMIRVELAEEQVGNLMGEKIRWFEDKVVLENTVFNMGDVIEQLQYERD
ncbi:hypothetical protein EHS16_08325 [Streptococcus anginosus]|nr:hypothetical protein EHS16_08325 [Streptococcus anginosus]